MNRIYDERIAESGKLEASHFEAKLKNVDRLFDAGQQYRAPKDAAVHVSCFEVSLSYNFYCLCKKFSPDSLDRLVGACTMVCAEPECLVVLSSSNAMR